jgi:hypothetical protein
LLSKLGGLLTKQIRLDENGVPKSDGSACVMTRGVACRALITCAEQLGALIGSLRSNQAIALGSLRPDLPREVKVATKRAINGAARPDIISRSAENIIFKPAQHGFTLLDFDTKGMPEHVTEQLAQSGGFWRALKSLIPELGNTARIRRASTSAGLSRTDTGAQVPGSNGLHIYLGVQDVADSVRFLKALHQRCWLAGYGWMMVSKNGQLLERSIVDRMVGAPERLVFEGPPILSEPLTQSAEARRPEVREGGWLDAQGACPPLSVLEKARLQDLLAKAEHRLTGEAASIRERYIQVEAEGLAKRSGMSDRAAREVLRKQCGGVLLPPVVLAFDDPELEGKTVADVLANPAAFEGETLADPLEGFEYGRCKARIMRRADGTPWIHSFAHGRTIYELKHDATAIRAAMAGASEAEVVSVLVEKLLHGEVESTEQAALIAYAKERSGTGSRVISGQIKNARLAKSKERAEQERLRRLAERDDPRPMLPAPSPDAPWLPEMGAYNDVLSKTKDRIPPARNIGIEAALARRVKIANLHAFSHTSTNQENQP